MFPCLAANVNHLECLWKSHLSQKSALQVVSRVSIAPEESLIQLQSRSEKHQKLKVQGNDLREMLLVMRQKLVFSVGAVALMWFSEAHQR